MKNWKTTLAGLVTGLFGFVAMNPELFAHYAWLIAMAKYATAGGFVSIGLLSKDSTTHSTTDEVLGVKPSAQQVQPTDGQAKP